MLGFGDPSPPLLCSIEVLVSGLEFQGIFWSVGWILRRRQSCKLLEKSLGEGGVLGISGCFVQSSICMKHDPKKNIIQVLLIDNNQESFWFPVLNPVLPRLGLPLSRKLLRKKLNLSSKESSISIYNISKGALFLFLYFHKNYFSFQFLVPGIQKITTN